MNSFEVNLELTLNNLNTYVNVPVPFFVILVMSITAYGSVIDMTGMTKNGSGTFSETFQNI